MSLNGESSDNLAPERFAKDDSWKDEVDRIRRERKELHDAWIRRRLQMQADCKYGTPEHTAEEMQAAVRLMCKADIFFFIDYFVWTYDPRERPEDQEMPFILYAYQVEFIKWFIGRVSNIAGTIERLNAVIEKSRDMGVTWIFACICAWYMIFHRASICYGTRVESECDKLGDYDTFMEKVRFIIKRMPAFLLSPEFDETKHLGYLLLRSGDGGQIVGESANPNFGRGGRNLFTIFDEFPAWEYDEAAWTSSAQSTNIRVAIFTPKGPFNKAAQLANTDPNDPDAEQIEKWRLHWSLHPIKAAGLRRDADGKLTSPWYEEQVRTMSADAVASELDISYTKSTKGLVFPDYLGETGTPMSHARGVLAPSAGSPLIRIWDPGLSFYVLFMQVDKYKRVMCLNEIYMENATIHDIAKDVLMLTQTEYRDLPVYDCGDPAGANRVSASQVDPEYVTLAEEYGIDVDYHFMQEMAPRVRVKNRIVAIHNKLREVVYQTRTPGLLVDIRKCPILHKALSEQYRYKVNKFTKQVMDQVDEYHPAEDAVDCLGYGILYKLGLATIASNKRQQVTCDRDGQVEWRGQLRRGH